MFNVFMSVVKSFKNKLEIDQNVLRFFKRLPRYFLELGTFLEAYKDIFIISKYLFVFGIPIYLQDFFQNNQNHRDVFRGKLVYATYLILFDYKEGNYLIYTTI